MGRVNDKLVLVTGAARGTGERTARLLAAEGARVVLCDVQDALGASVAKELGPSAQYAHLDVTREEIETLLRFHPLKFRYGNGQRYVARRAAGPLIARIVDALSAETGGASFTVLAGHDTNIADVGSLLGLTWHVDSYPEGDVPPGGALGFEVLRNASGVRTVRAFFRAQTMDQLRNQTPLTGKTPAYWQYLSIPGCNTEADPLTPCTIDQFMRVVDAKLQD